MQFRIRSTKIKISFSFLILFLLFSLNDNLKVYLISICASLLHELIHIFFVFYYKDSVSEISLNIFGGKIEKANKRLLSNLQEAVINLSAPAFNILLGVTWLCINNNSRWGLVNLFMGSFNMLPFSVFDGGRGLYYLLSIKTEDKTAKTIIHISSAVICIIFTIFSCYIFINYNRNYVLIMMSVFMLVTLFSKKNL